MPELPEVEIARRQLERWLLDRVVDEVIVVDPAVVRPRLTTRPSEAMPGGAAVVEGLVGQRCTGTARHGKRLGLHFERDSFAIHLGMTGQWMRRVPGEVPRFGKLGLRVGEHVVWFADSRRFGCVTPVPAEAVTALLAEGHGPDALDERMSGEALHARLSRSRRAIKVALLDQAVLAGVGNIHAVEALFRCQVAPTRRCDQLDVASYSALADAIWVQLDEAVREQDTEEFVYVNQGGENPFAVYGREGEGCPVCAAPIAALKQGGRTTFWCPSCQQ